MSLQRGSSAPGIALLTGAGGFVGKHLHQHLEQAGWTVSTLSRPQADLLAPETLSAPCRGVHSVFHLAGSAHVNHLDPAAVHNTNVTGTANLLQAAIDAGVQHFIYMSSVLADPALDTPRTAYGQSKHEAEQVLIQAHEAGHIRVSILRPANVYGPGMKGNLVNLIRLLQKGLLPSLPDTGQALSLVGVHDLCRATLAAADISTAPDEAVPVYIITDGATYTIKDIESAIRKALGKKQPHWSLPLPLLYSGALVLEVAGRLLRLRSAPGLRSYRAITRGNRVDDAASRQQLRYNPGATFYSELPALLAAMEHRD